MRERLIGAAVLVIIAVIMIPWLVSRAHHPRDVVTRTSWPASASAPAKPYVLPLQGTVPATAGGVAMAPGKHTANAGKVIRPMRMPPPVRTTPSVQAATGGTGTAVVHEKPGSAAAGPGATKTDNPPPANDGWIVQAASFSHLDAAQKLAGQLKQAGFNVNLSPHKVGKTTYYRVRVGPYPSEARARSAAPGVARISNTKVLIRSPGDGKG